MILKIDLNNFVRKSKHNCMSRSHPFLHINHVLNDSILRFSLLFLSVVCLCKVRLEFFSFFLVLLSVCWLFISIEIRSKMLKKSNFLLKILWIVCQRIFFSDILLIACSSLIVVKVMSSRIKNNFGGVIKEDSCCSI